MVGEFLTGIEDAQVVGEFLTGIEDARVVGEFLTGRGCIVCWRIPYWLRVHRWLENSLLV